MCIKKSLVRCICFMNCYIFVRLINLHAITVLSQVNNILFLIVIGMDQKDIMRLYFSLTVDLIYKFKCNLQNTSENQLH
jgi:hypothetical protein